MFAQPGPRGGMVDTRDLKSLGLIGRAGSSPAVGTRFLLILPLNYSIQGLALQKGNSNWVKKELNGVKNRRATMQEDDDDFGVTSEDTEILNLPLYTERKADSISPSTRFCTRKRLPCSCMPLRF